MELSRAVLQAVDLVNTHAGLTNVRLRFNDSDDSEFDFIANSATIAGDRFEFQAGVETVGGTLDELADIRAEVIHS